MTIIKKTSRGKGLFINPAAENKCADEMIGKINIKLNNKDQLVSSLSGGNQQKIVVAKWLLTNPDVIFLDEPTRGIDVGAKFEIYQLIQGLAKEGKAVLMISSEMPELLGICDRIIILKEGRIVGEVPAKEASQESIFSYIAKDNL
jgi:inositol transport system ATP-binding protein